MERAINVMDKSNTIVVAKQTDGLFKGNVLVS
jgi:hypothetical protein